MDLLDGHDTWQVVIGAKVCEVRRIAPTLDLDVNKARRYLVQLWPRSPDRLPIYLWLQWPVLLQIWNKMQHCRAPELPLNSYYALGFNKTGILALEHQVDIWKYGYFLVHFVTKPLILYRPMPCHAPAPDSRDQTNFVSKQNEIVNY